MFFGLLGKVVSIQGDELILEAFKRMRDNKIGGLPVVEGPKKKIVGNVSIKDIRYLLLKPELFSNFRYSKRQNFEFACGISLLCTLKFKKEKKKNQFENIIKPLATNFFFFFLNIYNYMFVGNLILYK